MTLLEYIEKLPDEIVILIKSFIPINVLFELNNTYFNRFFPTILNKQRFPYLAYYNYIGNSAEKYVKNVTFLALRYLENTYKMRFSGPFDI